MRVQTFSISAALFLAVTAGVYLWLSQDIVPEQPQSLGIQIPMDLSLSPAVEPLLNSDIPPYNLAVSRQVVEPVSIRRMDVGSMDDEDDSASKESMVVLDKVVVAPKILRHAPSSQALADTKTALQNGYTIQLLASHDSIPLERFIQAHHLGAQAQIRHVIKEGRAWYILTIGEYHQREAARHAIAQLPMELAQFKPWVRQVSDLKTS